ncbi:MAG: class I SAM-dependent methyltransferase [Gammaproteobacteria bacterium]|nr:class I SAM-dependent methyltransferase [Gammaproteobacteria bacterium]MDH3468291.1 class I SAM-dependent methyltransferase [Gammaproteobacteria bacterium]
MSSAQHWNEVYSAKPADKVGWYTPHLNTSLNWIQELSLEPHEAIIDVGGGASTLVDDLLDGGHSNIIVLDLSKCAIQLTQERLGARFSSVTWMEGDVTEAKLPTQHYRLWHDRAVFHFLVQPKERRRYKDALLKALRIDGFVIVGTFSPDAPPQCSGLPVQRYTADTLSKCFGDKFELRRHQYESHTTPSGIKQSYVFCLYQRKA